MERYVEIRDTDLNICRVGLGTVNAGLAWDTPESYSILDEYIEQGGNFIDSARIYSDWVKPETGRSERVLGDWIRHRGHHNDFILATKGGHPEMGQMCMGRLLRAEMEKDLELSLRALSIDTIDIYFYHRDDNSRPVEELIEIMENFVKSGKIRYYACSNWNTERMLLADSYCGKMGYRGFIMNQAHFNFCSRSMKPFSDKTMISVDEGMRKFHHNHTENILVAYMSLCAGFFHKLDSLGEEAVKNSPYYSKENLCLFGKIKSIARNHDTGITQALLGFVLTREPPMISLAGVSQGGHIRSIMDAFNHKFYAEEFEPS